MSYTYPGREAVAVKALSDFASASLGMSALLVGISLTRQDESGVTDGVDKPSHILDEGKLAEEDVWRSVSFVRCNAGATTCAMALRMRQTTGLHQAGMGGLLRQLPDGHGTVVGHAANASPVRNGNAAIARAVLHNWPLLIL